MSVVSLFEAAMGFAIRSLGLREGRRCKGLERRE